MKAVRAFAEIQLLVLGVIFLCMLPLIFLMKPPQKNSGAVMVH
jgi:hypothetical protein